MLVREAMPGKAITHARNPFLANALLTQNSTLENSGVGEEKHQLMTTVIRAGKKRSGFRISGAAHCSGLRWDVLAGCFATPALAWEPMIHQLPGSRYLARNRCFHASADRIW